MKLHEIKPELARNLDYVGGRRIDKHAHSGDAAGQLRDNFSGKRRGQYAGDSIGKN